VAHGNFTPEVPPSTEAPRVRDRSSLRETPRQEAEVPVSSAKQDDPTYMAVIIGVLTAVILLLAVAIFLIVTRHRQRKNFASPLGAKSSIPAGAHQHLANESAYGTAEKDPSLMTYRADDMEDRYAGAKLTTLPRELNDRLLGDVRLDDYQEPFHESGSGKYRESVHAAYYGYSTVVIDNKDLHDNVEQSGERRMSPPHNLLAPPRHPPLQRAPPRLLFGNYAAGPSASSAAPCPLRRPSPAPLTLFAPPELDSRRRPVPMHLFMRCGKVGRPGSW
jgi:hypothetical protein